MSELRALSQTGDQRLRGSMELAENTGSEPQGKAKGIEQSASSQNIETFWASSGVVLAALVVL